MLPASKAHIWAVPNGCRGWSKIVAPYRNQGDTPHATRQGLVSHRVAHEILDTGKEPQDFLGEEIDGIVVDQDMIDSVLVYVASLHDHVSRADKFRLEDRVADGCVVDAWAYYEETQTLHVWDFKDGWGVVEADDNYQLAIYAKEIRTRWNLRVSNWELTIVQPRPWHPWGPCRRWKPTVEELSAIHVNVETARVECEDPAAPVRSGSHCVKCEARHVCMAAHMASMNAIDVTASPTPAEMTGEEIGYEFELLNRAAEAIELRRTGLETQIMGMMDRGETVTGWQRQEKMSSLKWTGDYTERVQMADLVGVDIRKKPETITPTQALKAGVPRELVEGLSAKYPAGFKLQRIKQEHLNRIFSQGDKNV